MSNPTPADDEILFDLDDGAIPVAATEDLRTAHGFAAYARQEIAEDLGIDATQIQIDLRPVTRERHETLDRWLQRATSIRAHHGGDSAVEEALADWRHYTADGRRMFERFMEQQFRIAAADGFAPTSFPHHPRFSWETPTIPGLLEAISDREDAPEPGEPVRLGPDGTVVGCDLGDEDAIGYVIATEYTDDHVIATIGDRPRVHAPEPIDRDRTVHQVLEDIRQTLTGFADAPRAEGIADLGVQLRIEIPELDPVQYQDLTAPLLEIARATAIPPGLLNMPVRINPHLRPGSWMLTAERPLSPIPPPGARPFRVELVEGISHANPEGIYRRSPERRPRDPGSPERDLREAHPNPWSEPTEHRPLTAEALEATIEELTGMPNDRGAEHAETPHPGARDPLGAGGVGDTYAGVLELTNEAIAGPRPDPPPVATLFGLDPRSADD